MIRLFTRLADAVADWVVAGIDWATTTGSVPPQYDRHTWTQYDRLNAAINERGWRDTP